MFISQLYIMWTSILRHTITKFFAKIFMNLFFLDVCMSFPFSCMVREHADDDGGGGVIVETPSTSGSPHLATSDNGTILHQCTSSAASAPLPSS